MPQVLARLRALSPRMRATLAALLVAAVLAIGVAVAAQRDARVPLFAAPLYPEQLTEVVESLAAANVPFVAGTDNVRVDGKRRNDVLLRLSLAGVPHAHLTSSGEALAKASPLTPQSVLDAQQRDGLAGDIATSLRGIAGVADAHVIIAPAKPASFADETPHDAGASVRIDVRPGATLTPSAIAGIRAFVANGVAGLDAKRVAIVDDRGLALAETAGTAAADGSDESRLQGSLQSALDLAFGGGATVVRVRVSRDPRSRETHDVRRSATGPTAITVASSDERYHGPSKNYLKRTASEDRGSDLHDERTITPQNGVARISVAILVDAARRLDVRQIRADAVATLGLDTADGAAVSVEAVPFAASVVRAPPPWMAVLGMAGTLAPTLILVVGGIAALKVGLKPTLAALEAASRRMALRGTTAAVAGFPPAQVRGALVGEPPHTAAAVISALPTATATAVLELYPPEERAAIVRRMTRANAPVVPDYEALLRLG